MSVRRVSDSSCDGIFDGGAQGQCPATFASWFLSLGGVVVHQVGGSGGRVSSDLHLVLGLDTPGEEGELDGRSSFWKTPSLLH